MKHAWEFKLLTEREIHIPYLENAKFLSPYHKQPLNWDYAHPMLEMMRELREADPESLLVALTSDRWKQAEMLPTLWHLVVARMIGVDLTEKITMRSRIFAKL